jgi:hypothetical protein
VGDGEKLLTYLNSVLKFLLGTDSFPRVPKKKVKFCCPVKYVNIHIFSLFFTFNLSVTKKTVGDGEKLLTYLNSALKVLSGLDIFPLGTKKKLNFVDQCNYSIYLKVTGYMFRLTKQPSSGQLQLLNQVHIRVAHCAGSVEGRMKPLPTFSVGVRLWPNLDIRI